MFLQVVDSIYMAFTDSAGESWYKKNDVKLSDGTNLNGKLHAGEGAYLAYLNYTVGGTDSLPPPDTTSPPLYTGWEMGGNSSVPDKNGRGTPEVADQPSFMRSSTDRMITCTENFTTYLMCMPKGIGVWVAISQADWTWTETATRLGISPLFGVGSNQAEPMISSPGGDDSFPTWVNDASVFLSKKENVFRSGNPGP